MQCIAGIVRNQQCLTAGNHIVTCGQGCVVHQDNVRTRSHSSVPIIKQLRYVHLTAGQSAHTEDGIAAILGKHSLQRHIASGGKGIRIVSGYDLASCIRPTQEGPAGVGGSGKVDGFALVDLACAGNCTAFAFDGYRKLLQVMELGVNGAVTRNQIGSGSEFEGSFRGQCRGIAILEPSHKCAVRTGSRNQGILISGTLSVGCGRCFTIYGISAHTLLSRTKGDGGLIPDKHRLDIIVLLIGKGETRFCTNLFFTVIPSRKLVPIVCVRDSIHAIAFAASFSLGEAIGCVLTAYSIGTACNSTKGHCALGNDVGDDQFALIIF